MYIDMCFWEMVVNELDYQGKPRKWLAEEIGIDVSTIGTGIRRKSIPQADIAYKVSTLLNVSLDHLLSESLGEVRAGIHNSTPNYELYSKYRKVLENLDRIPEAQRDAIINLISVSAE